MRAMVGDRIVLASNQVDRPVRDGRIVEVRHGDGSPPYVVEWTDTGQTGLVFPGPDAHVEAAEMGDAPTPATSQPAAAGRLVKKWHVEVDVIESGDRTTAHAVLVDGPPAQLGAEGRADRNPHDRAVSDIGDEVAAARALHHLADGLLELASKDITAVEGRRVSLPG